MFGVKPWEVADIPAVWVNAKHAVDEIKRRAAETARQLKPSGGGGKSPDGNQQTLR